MSEKVIPLVLKEAYENNISLEFLRYAIMAKVQNNPFTFTNKGGKTRLGTTQISIPINDNGEFDFMAQNSITEHYQSFIEIKEEIHQNNIDMESLIVDIDLSNYSMKEFPLPQILDPIKGNSKYTKKYGDTHKGEFPVYSASSNAPLTHIDTFDFEGNYLSWATNGFAGTVTVLENKFSINGDRGILLPKVDNVDIQYLKYILQPIFRRIAKGRKGDRGADEFTKLYPSMIADVQIPFPVDKTGNISLTYQGEIAQSYLTIERYKREILEKLNTLLEQKISY